MVYPNGDTVSYVMTVFECKVVSGEAAPDHEETLDIRYFAESELNIICHITLGEDGLARCFQKITRERGTQLQLTGMRTYHQVTRGVSLRSMFYTTTPV